MAGTRLWVQGAALFQVVILTFIALHGGFCSNDDVLCRRLVHLAYPPKFDDVPPLLPSDLLIQQASVKLGVPSLDSSMWEAALESSVQLDLFDLHPMESTDLQSICQTHRRPIEHKDVQLFVCPNNGPEDSDVSQFRCVVRNGTTFIHPQHKAPSDQTAESLLQLLASSNLREFNNPVAPIRIQTHFYIEAGRQNIQSLVPPVVQDALDQLRTHLADYSVAIDSAITTHWTILPKAQSELWMKKYDQKKRYADAQHDINATTVSGRTIVGLESHEILPSLQSQLQAYFDGRDDDDSSSGVSPTTIHLEMYIPKNLPLPLANPEENVWNAGLHNTLVALISQENIEEANPIEGHKGSTNHLIHNVFKGISELLLQDLTGINGASSPMTWDLDKSYSLPQVWIESRQQSCYAAAYSNAHEVLTKARRILSAANSISSTNVPPSLREAYHDALEQWKELAAVYSDDAQIEMLRSIQYTADSIPRKLRMEKVFLIEHYFALFAPLLFPLLLPFTIQLISERKRYKEKLKQKKDGKESEGTDNEGGKNKTE